MRQPTLSRSNAEVEYHGVTNAIAGTCWLRNLLHLVAAGQVRVLYVPSRYQYADIFTKGLPSALFEEFRTSLSVRCPPTPTVGTVLEGKLMYFYTNFRSNISQGYCFIHFDIKQSFSRLVNLLEVKQHVSASVKEIDNVQLGIVNQVKPKLLPGVLL
ncbi:ribonuclease H-like domain-containing protein [Tanacetum coccineum]